MTPTMNGTLKNLNAEDLKALARQAGPCVTMQVPAHQPGSTGGSRQAYLRQLTHTALEQLRNMDRPEEAARTTAALEDLIASLPVDHGGPGMTIFCAPGFQAAFETPGVREQVTVADHFFLLPNLATALAPQDFFILGLSQNHLRLFHYLYGHATELPLPAGVPVSLAVAGAFDKPDHNVEGRSSGGPSTGNMRGVRFGVSADHDSEAEYLRHFFELVDRGLKGTLGGAPLFLAGVREEIGLYRKAAKYGHIMEAECHGNAVHSTVDQVAKHAAAGATREYRTICERTLNGLSEVPNKVLEPKPVCDAAMAGRVHRIFVAEDADPGARTLINNAVVEGLRTGADLLSFPGAEIPGFGSIAATLRY